MLRGQYSVEPRVRYIGPGLGALGPRSRPQGANIGGSGALGVGLCGQDIGLWVKIGVSGVSWIKIGDCGAINGGSGAKI